MISNQMGPFHHYQVIVVFPFVCNVLIERLRSVLLHFWNSTLNTFFYLMPPAPGSDDSENHRLRTNIEASNFQKSSQFLFQTRKIPPFQIPLRIVHRFSVRKRGSLLFQTPRALTHAESPFLQFFSAHPECSTRIHVAHDQFVSYGDVPPSQHGYLRRSFGDVKMFDANVRPARMIQMGV